MKRLLSLTALLAVTSVGTAQGFPKAIVDINNQHLGIDAAGMVGFDLFEPDEAHTLSHQVPAGTKLRAIFGGAPWLGGISEGDTFAVTDRFRQVYIGWMPGPIMKDQSDYPSQAYKWDRVWKVSKSEIDIHLANFTDASYQMPEAIENWPAHGDPAFGQAVDLAPYIDVNNNSQYDPENGDYPAIRGDQAVFFIMNDHREDTTMLQYQQPQPSPAMRVEVHGMLYGFDCPVNPTLDHALFLEYRMINRGQHAFSDTYMGQWMDFDLGNAQDDRIECNVEQSTFYIRNGDAEDQTIGDTAIHGKGYGTNLGIFGVTFLKGPALIDDNVDNAIGIGQNERPNGFGFGDGIIDNEHMGMERFMYHNNTSGPTGDSDDPKDCYKLLSGHWYDNTPLRYGGNGYIPYQTAHLPAKYMFPGESDPLHYGTFGVDPTDSNLVSSWTEVSAGNTPNDRRGIGITGPFTFEPGDEVVLDLALVFARAPWGQDSAALMDAVVDIRSMYTSGLTPCGGFWPTSNQESVARLSVKAYPNPSSGIVYLSGASDDAVITIFGIDGRQVYSTHAKQLDLTSLKKGSYTIRIQEGVNVHHFIQILQ